MAVLLFFFFFFSSRRRHTRLQGDWSSDVCSSDLAREASGTLAVLAAVLAAAALVACEQPAGLNEPTPTVSSLMVSPQAITLLPNQVADFMAVRVTSTGDTAPMSVTWSVTSGAVTHTASNGGRHHRPYKAGPATRALQ